MLEKSVARSMDTHSLAIEPSGLPNPDWWSPKDYVAARATGPNQIPPQQPPGAHRRPRAGGGGDRAQGVAEAIRFLYSSRTQPTLNQPGTPRTRAHTHTFCPHTPLTATPPPMHTPHMSHLLSNITQQISGKLICFIHCLIQSPCIQVFSHPGKTAGEQVGGRKKTSLQAKA